MHFGLKHEGAGVTIQVRKHQARLYKSTRLAVRHLGAQHNIAEGQVFTGEGELGAKAGS